MYLRPNADVFSFYWPKPLQATVPCAGRAQDHLGAHLSQRRSHRRSVSVQFIILFAVSNACADFFVRAPLRSCILRVRWALD